MGSRVSYCMAQTEEARGCMRSSFDYIEGLGVWGFCIIVTIESQSWKVHISKRV